MSEPLAQARRKLVYRDQRKLRGYARNARTHTPEQIRQIRASIDAFGFNSPILLRDDDTTVGAGHARLEAARLEPPPAAVPTITLAGLTEAQWRAYVIADNKLALWSGWDEDTLRDELAAIGQAGEDLALTGFGTDELANLGVAGFELNLDPIGDPPDSSYAEQYGVVVVCAGEAEQKAVYERLAAEGLNCKVVKV